MAFYRDSDGAIWQTRNHYEIQCLIDPEVPDDEVVGDPFSKLDVEELYGPLVEVRPADWEEV